MSDTESSTTWPRLLTVVEVAKVLRVSKMTVYRMVHDGELRAVKVGRGFRVEAASLRELLRANAVPVK
ncbi:MAG TPA: helix-turn-helix domain-containing protein [Trebonia sp.]|jgi:excisionase family DNA binding protein